MSKMSTTMCAMQTRQTAQRNIGPLTLLVFLTKQPDANTCRSARGRRFSSAGAECGVPARPAKLHGECVGAAGGRDICVDGGNVGGVGV